MRTYLGVATCGVGVTFVLGALAWWLVPAKWTVWLVVMGLPPLLWGYLEVANSGTTEAARAIRGVHRIGIGVLGLFIALDLGPDLGIALGWLDPGLEPLALQLRGLAVGAFFVLSGNHLPKIMSPWSLETEPFDWHTVHRFVGRVFVVAGLALMVVWGVTPADARGAAAERIVLMAMALALGRKLLSVLHYSLRGRSLSR